MHVILTLKMQLCNYRFSHEQIPSPNKMKRISTWKQHEGGPIGRGLWVFHILYIFGLNILYLKRCVLYILGYLLKISHIPLIFPQISSILLVCLHKYSISWKSLTGPHEGARAVRKLQSEDLGMNLNM